MSFGKLSDPVLMKVPEKCSNIRLLWLFGRFEVKMIYHDLKCLGVLKFNFSNFRKDSNFKNFEFYLALWIIGIVQALSSLAHTALRNWATNRPKLLREMDH